MMVDTKIAINKFDKMYAGVLIIDPSVTSQSWLTKELAALGADIRCEASVDAYLDNPDTRHRSIVLFDADVFNPESVSEIIKLRTYFGEGASTQIIAMVTFSPGAFSTLLERAGCDQSVVKTVHLTEVVSAAVSHMQQLACA